MVVGGRPEVVESFFILGAEHRRRAYLLRTKTSEGVLQTLGYLPKQVRSVWDHCVMCGDRKGWLGALEGSTNLGLGANDGEVCAAIKNPQRSIRKIRAID